LLLEQGKPLGLLDKKSSKLASKCNIRW